MENVYSPPKAQLVEKPASTFGPPFFIISIRKLTLLYLMTWGYFAFYWFFKHWFTQRRHAGEKVTPLWRSIFYLFFVHSLFHLITARLALMEKPYWRYSAAPHALVVLALASSAFNLLQRAAELSPPVFVAGLIVLIAGKLVAFIGMQRLANAASGDPKGTTNDTLSGWNWAFIAVGGLCWIMALSGAAAWVLR